MTDDVAPCAHVPHRTGSSTMCGAGRRQGACTGRFTRSACTACGVAGTHTCESLSVIASASLSSSVAILAFSIALFLKSTVAIVGGQPSKLGRSFLLPPFPPVCPPPHFVEEEGVRQLCCTAVVFPRGLGKLCAPMASWMQGWMGRQTKCFALLLAASCACGTARGFLASPGSLQGHRSRPLGLSGARASVCVLREAQGTTAERRVKCIFSDVDGTLLDKQHRLQPDTRAAILEAVAADIPFVMATGKSRGPWIHELRRELGLESPGYGLNGPAVFIQGLLVCDDRGLAVQQLTLPVDPRLLSPPCLLILLACLATAGHRIPLHLPLDPVSCRSK